MTEAERRSVPPERAAVHADPTAVAGLHASVHRSDDAIVAAAEQELDAATFPLPLPSRAAWARHLGGKRHHTAIVRDSSGRCLASIGISLTHTRALLGHCNLRIEGLGPAYVGPAGVRLLKAIVAFGRQQPRILRVVVEVACRGNEGRAELQAQLREAGFAPIALTRVSVRTLAIDLQRPEDDVLASFGRSTRQNIRAASKHGLELEPIEDARYGPRMNALLAVSLARTGAEAPTMEWGSIAAVCRALPDRSRVIGVFRGASREPADLVGYAWGLHHGDRVEYGTGASDRIPGVRLPILYPALWDLIRWGRRTGGTWFDLGGVTPGSVGSPDALGGISDFKRGFSKDEIDLGEEWAFTPRPFRARVAAWTSALAQRVRDAGRQRPSATAATLDHSPAAAGAEPQAD